MSDLAIIDPRDITITPVFKIIEVEDISASEKAGRAVMKPLEVVEVRFAGSRNYAPVFPAGATWRRENNRSITYAERWGDAYRAFKEGNPQEAVGTPLEMLKPQGITPELVSLCRALKIYSIEALHALEGPGLKSLGMNGNRLKDMARAYMAGQASSAEAMNELEALRKRVAELEASGARVDVPAEQTPPEQVDEMVDAADKAVEEMDQDELKAEIAKHTGSKPRGTPTMDSLRSTVSELREAASA